MADFAYQEMFPLEADSTEYRLLTKEHVSLMAADGKRLMQV
jgi:fumarate hydratase class I